MGKRLYTREVFKVNLVFFLLFCTFTLFWLLPVHITALGGDRRDIGLIMGAFGLSAFLSRFLFGGWIDRFGRRPLLLLGALLTVPATAGFLWVRSPGIPAVALRALQGAGMAAFFTAAFTMASDAFPPERMAEGLGIFGLAGMLAQAVGPEAGEELIRFFGFPGLFLFSGLLASVALLIGLFVKESPLRGDPRPPPIREALPPGIRRILLLAIVYAAGRGAQVSFLADFALTRGIVNVGPYFVVYAVTCILLRIGTRRLADRAGKRRVLLPALILFASSLAFLAAVRDLRGLLAAGFLSGAAQAYTYPVLNALAIHGASDRARGRLMTLFSAAFDLGMGAGGVAMGFVARAWGYGFMYALSALLVLLSVVLIRLPGGQRKRRNDGAVE